MKLVQQKNLIYTYSYNTTIFVDMKFKDKNIPSKQKKNDKVLTQATFLLNPPQNILSEGGKISLNNSM